MAKLKLLLLFALLGTLTAQEIGGVKYHIEQPISLAEDFGTCVVTISLENTTDRKRDVSVKIVDPDYNLMTSSKKGSIQPGAVHKWEIQQPNMFENPIYLEIKVQGFEKIQEPLTSPQRNQMTWLVDSDFEIYPLGKGIEWSDIEFNHGQRRRQHNFLDTVTVNRDYWPQNWLQFTNVHAVGMDAKSWQKLANQTKIEIESYVQCGGTLVLTHHGKTEIHPSGFGFIVKVEGDFADEPERFRRSVLKSMAIQGFYSESAEHTIKVPIYPSYFLVIFILIAGPMGFYLIKTQKRMLLYTVVPALSILISLILWSLSYILVEKRLEQKALVYLNQETSQSFQITNHQIETNKKLTNGMSFSLNSDLAFSGLDLGYYSRRKKLRTQISLEEQVRWKGDPLRAYRPALVQSRTPVAERRRLAITQEGSQLQITNYLGFPLKSLRIRTIDGMVGTAQNIDAEATVSVQVFDPNDGPQFGTSRTVASLRELSAKNKSIEVYQTFFQHLNPPPGHYAVEMLDCDFVANPIDADHEEYTIIIGRYAWN